MRLFRKPSPQAEEDAQSSTSKPRRTLLAEDVVLAQLEATTESARRTRSRFVVICLAPQLLAAEELPRAELANAIDVMEQHLRPADYVGRYGPVRFLAVLPDTAEKPGQVVSYRIATELTMRSARFNHRKWFAGYATFPSDANEAVELVRAASDNAKARPTSPPPTGDMRLIA